MTGHFAFLQVKSAQDAMLGFGGSVGGGGGGVGFNFGSSEVAVPHPRHHHLTRCWPARRVSGSCRTTGTTRCSTITAREAGTGLEPGTPRRRSTWTTRCSTAFRTGIGSTGRSMTARLRWSRWRRSRAARVCSTRWCNGLAKIAAKSCKVVFYVAGRKLNPETWSWWWCALFAKIDWQVWMTKKDKSVFTVLQNLVLMK